MHEQVHVGLHVCIHVKVPNASTDSPFSHTHPHRFLPMDQLEVFLHVDVAPGKWWAPQAASWTDLGLLQGASSPRCQASCRRAHGEQQ